MDTLTALSVVTLAGLIHASFQLSVSMATSLSGHALGRRLAAKRTLRLLGGFLLGAVIMTLLCVTFTTYTIGIFAPPSLTLWTGLAVALLFVGLAVVLFYYRHTDGTELWIPRSFAHFLRKRTAKANLVVESFSLGLASVVSEIIFIIVPIIAASCAIITLPEKWQLVGVCLYTLLASIGLTTVIALIGGGQKLSHIQRWREHNKQFLQFASGLGLIILGFFIYVTVVSDVITHTGVL